MRLPCTCHFCACRARRENPQCLAKSSPYAGPSAGTEVARLRKWHVWCLLVVYPRAAKLFTLLDVCVSSLRRGHANIVCIVPMLTDDPRRESQKTTKIGYYKHLFTIIATLTVLWRPLRGPRSTVRMVLLRTSAVIGYYRHLFAIIATPTVLLRPLSKASA